MVQKCYDIAAMEIALDLLKNEKNHIRGIAKNLGASHATILRKVNEMLAENIVDSRREGKNRVFYLRKNLNARNYIYMAELYKANKFLSHYPQMSVIMGEVLKATKSGMIIVFGSYARFSSKKGSDIDIFIETKDASLGKRLKLISRKISLKTGVFDTHNLLIREIIKEHIIFRGVEEFYEKTKFFE